MTSRGMRVFLGLAAATLVGVVAMPSKGSGPASPDVTPAVPAATPGAGRPPGPAPMTTGTPAGLPGALGAVRAHIASLEWGRDPFASPAAEFMPVAVVVVPEPEPEPVVPLPVLSGIATTPALAMAILDQQVVEPGDVTPAGFQVLAITRGSVTLLREGSQHTLSLSERRR